MNSKLIQNKSHLDTHYHSHNQRLDKIRKKKKKPICEFNPKLCIYC